MVSSVTLTKKLNWTVTSFTTSKIIIDRLIIRQFDDVDSDDAQAFETRLTDAIETALELGDGVIIIQDVTDRDNPVDHMYSEDLACPNGHGSVPEPEPRLFSFNTPSGACPTCQGLGFSLEIDQEMVVPNADKSIADGAINANGWNVDDKESWTWNMFKSLANIYDFSLNTPWKDLTKKQQDIILYGVKGKKIQVNYVNSSGHERTYTTRYEGVIPNLERRYEQTESDYIRSRIQEYMREKSCRACGGLRLRPEAIAVLIHGKNIHEITTMPISELHEWVDSLRGEDPILTEREQEIAKQILRELESRVGFLNNVGLNYLSLSRTAATLSGGESQRDPTCNTGRQSINWRFVCVR
jgi:excinuclease ABC subunit A